MQVALHCIGRNTWAFLRRPPSNGAGPFDIGGSEKKTRRRTRCCAISIAATSRRKKTKIFACTRHLFLWPHFIICQLKFCSDPASTKIDQIPAVGTFKKINLGIFIILLLFFFRYTRVRRHADKEYKESIFTHF